MKIKGKQSPACLTCRALLQLLVFLFPPFPRPENTPQRGQLAVAPDGRGVDSTHQTAGAQHLLLLHHICNTQDRQEPSASSSDMNM